jgi:hypothetical protein
VLAAHIPISTSTDTDFFLGFCVLPGDEQDRVYAAVKRVVNGSTVYYLEKFALDSEAKVDDVTKVMDAHVTFGAGLTTISGLTHLEGRTVVAWADGAPVVQLGTTTTQNVRGVGRADHLADCADDRGLRRPALRLGI